jgi:hypothetical protein
MGIKVATWTIRGTRKFEDVKSGQISVFIISHNQPSERAAQVSPRLPPPDALVTTQELLLIQGL